MFACEIGGVHPALIEAMAAQNATLYLDTPENNETAGDAAVPYNKDEASLAAKLQDLLDNEAEREQWGQRARQRAQELFAWEAIANKYERLFEEVVAKG